MKRNSIKQHIIETASRLFYDKGYNLTGINEIIKEAGIAKATLYSHFKSKEDICLAYLVYKHEGFLIDITNFTKKPAKGKKQLLALFDFLKAFFKDKDFNGCWCLNTISEIPKDNQKIRAEIQKQKNQFLAFIVELLKSNFPDEKIRSRNVLAKKIYLLYETAVAESHLHQASWPIASAKDIAKMILPA